MADRRLQVFHAVAKHLSFTKAAEALFMTQPAVTFQIRQLEEHFNTRLFDRAHGRIALTPAGQAALEYAERILELSAEMDTRMKEMGGQVAGALLIGASTTIAEYLLPPVLGEFKMAYPGVVPRLFVANSEAVQARIAERTLDLGFIEGESHLPSLVTDVCCDDELQVVCAPAHPLARQAAATPQMLAEYPYVSREPGSGTREVIDSYLDRAGVRPDSLQVVMELGSPEAIKGLLSAGNAFAIMSRATAAKEARAGELARVPLAPRLTRHLSVVYPKERFHSRLVNSFVQFAKERLAAQQAAESARPAA
ncbi:MAG: LysR family transcriptional regulator [Betaproteobacteria bacterium]|nr:LysR family transcriptional regulator [Betaproteobacteria bacterium]MDH5220562.1 LysR family transcriptional regulator [Betaproteobacteria bacterium]MDH5351167.1 LysR family transcriptional regulator [Betaproteobacteria bacterium]